MKNFFYIFAFFYFIGCAAQTDTQREQQENGRAAKIQEEITRLRANAITKFDFYELEKNIDEFNGQILQVDGYIIDTAHQTFLMYADPYFEDNYGFFYVFIDNPLPRQTAPGKPLRHLTIGDKITLIAELNGLKTYPLEKKTIRIPIKTYELSISGEEFENIPSLLALAIYRDQSNQLKYPDWVSVKISPEFKEEEY